MVAKRRLLYFKPMAGFVVRLGGSGNFYCVVIWFLKYAVGHNFHYKYILFLYMGFDSPEEGPICSNSTGWVEPDTMERNLHSWEGLIHTTECVWTQLWVSTKYWSYWSMLSKAQSEDWSRVWQLLWKSSVNHHIPDLSYHSCKWLSNGWIHFLKQCLKSINGNLMKGKDSSLVFVKFIPRWTLNPATGGFFTVACLGCRHGK